MQYDEQYMTEREKQLADEADNTPEGKLLLELGRRYWHTESTAREVARFAADRISVQQAEIERLRSALHRIARYACEDGKCQNSAVVSVSMRKIAKEALREQPSNLSHNDEVDKL